MQNKALPVPKENIEQTRLFEWANWQRGAYPELDMMYHIPNGGSRNKLEARNLKAQGVKAGVPDICLPVPRGGYHGLYVELKRQRGGIATDKQGKWLDKLCEQGYCAVLCEGWEIATHVILLYLAGAKIEDICKRGAKGQCVVPIPAIKKT